VSAPTIDPAVLTDTVAAHRMAELVDLYFQHNPPGRYQTDAADELQALAAAVRQRTGWGDVEDFDRNDAGDRCLRAFGLEFDPDNSFDPCEVAA